MTLGKSVRLAGGPTQVIRLGADAIAVAIGVRGPNEGRFLQHLSAVVDAMRAFQAIVHDLQNPATPKVLAAENPDGTRPPTRLPGSRMPDVEPA